MDRIESYKSSQRRRGKFVYFGGLDATKFADKQGFSDYFRKSYDPAEPVIVPVDRIVKYITEPDGNGRLNVRANININFPVPANVFSNYLSSESGSRLRYIIDDAGIITNLSFRCFALNPIQHVLLRNLNDLAQSWNRNPLGYVVPKILDFENLTTLDNLYFDDYRDGNDIINIRNANNFLENPSTDDVLRNYNQNGNEKLHQIFYEVLCQLGDLNPKKCPPQNDRHFPSQNLSRLLTGKKKLPVLWQGPHGVVNNQFQFVNMITDVIQIGTNFLFVHFGLLCHVFYFIGNFPGLNHIVGLVFNILDMI